MTYLDTGLWADVRELPGALGATLDAAEGVAEAAALLRDGGVERIVATGNGAAYYVAHALWLAALEGAPGGPPIVAVPCGVAVRDRFRWEPGDAVLAVSSSGEFRDVVELAQRGGRPCVAITGVGGLLAGDRRHGHRAPARRRAARRHAHAGRSPARTRAGSPSGRPSPATRSSPRCWPIAPDAADAAVGGRRGVGVPGWATCTSRTPPSWPAAASPGPRRWSWR